MDPISINHAQLLSSSINAKRPETEGRTDIVETFTAADPTVKASTEVVISPLASELSELSLKSRFTSMEEFSAHSTELYSQLLTTEEIQSGSRRNFASAEDERLSHLTLKELMDESNKLSLVDENGHSSTSFYGNEQSDRLQIAVGNLLLANQVKQRDAATSVEKSVSTFKSVVEEKLGISAKGYDIVFKDGKATAVGKMSSSGEAASSQELEKIQKLLDNPSSNPSAQKVLSDINEYNQTSWQLVDNILTQRIHGGEQNRYLSTAISSDWLMEGSNYSNVSKGNGLYEKYVEIVASANIKYQAALQDGSHFLNNRTDPGILEATRIRDSLSVRA